MTVCDGAVAKVDNQSSTGATTPLLCKVVRKFLGGKQWLWYNIL